MTKEQRQRLALQLMLGSPESESEEDGEAKGEDAPALSKDLEERLVSQALSAMGQPGDSVAPGGTPVINLSARRAERLATVPAREPAVPKKAPRWLWRAGAAAALLIVAVSALRMMSDGDGPALPAYELERGGATVTLGNEAIDAHVPADGLVRITLRPTTALSGPVNVHAYRQRVGGAPEDWPAGQPEAAGKAGTFLLRKPARDLGLSPGQWTLIFVLSRPGEAKPSPEQAAKSAKLSESTGPRRFLAEALTVEPAP